MSTPNSLRRLVSRFPLVSFFTVAFAASGAALVVLGPPRLSAGGTSNPASLAVFPVLVVTVAIAGIGLTAIVDGSAGIRKLWSRMHRWWVAPRLFAALLIPPAGILLTLTVMKVGVSSAFAPGFFPVGIAFGLIAGFFEEIGWTGFAYPRLSARFGAVGGAAFLGLLWGLWHVPVVDSLGVASPHGPAWPVFFAAFVSLLMAIRMLICWLYSKTGSIVIAQLMHASSTGFLVVLSAPHVSSAQEALSYAAYGGLLWVGIATAVILRRRGRWPDRSTVSA